MLILFMLFSANVYQVQEPVPIVYKHHDINLLKSIKRSNSKRIFNDYKKHNIVSVLQKDDFVRILENNKKNGFAKIHILKEIDGRVHYVDTAYFLTGRYLRKKLNRIDWWDK